MESTVPSSPLDESKSTDQDNQQAPEIPKVSLKDDKVAEDATESSLNLSSLSTSIESIVDESVEKGKIEVNNVVPTTPEKPLPVAASSVEKDVEATSTETKAVEIKQTKETKIVQPQVEEDLPAPPVAPVSVIDSTSVTNDAPKPEIVQRTHLRSGHFFSQYAQYIAEPVFRGLTECGFSEMSQIQMESLPVIAQGNSLVAQAQSGSGKTLAFVLGALAHFRPMTKPASQRPRGPQLIFLAPTHELVHQLMEDTLLPLIRYIPTTVKLVKALGKSQLPRGHLIEADIIAGTPGAVASLIQLKNLFLDDLKVLAIDEADFVLEVKEGSAVKVVTSNIPPSCIKLFFSATFTTSSFKFCQQIMGGGGNPGNHGNASSIKSIRIPRRQLVLDEIVQVLVECPAGFQGSSNDFKLSILKEIYSLSIEQSIIFVETKVECHKVVEKMQSLGFPVSELHGGLPASSRAAVMDAFKRHQTRVLVTTNVLARGLNVPTVAVVINYSPPLFHDPQSRSVEPDPHLYIHRIGRTARFGRPGLAINLVGSEQRVHVPQAFQGNAHGNANQSPLMSEREVYRRIEELIDPSLANTVEADRIQRSFLKRWTSSMRELKDFFEERTRNYVPPASLDPNERLNAEQDGKSNKPKGFDEDRPDDIDIRQFYH